MKIEEIREKREELEDRRNKANAEMRRVRLEFQLLADYCSHPEAYTYSAMGELGTKCPDCGHQT